MLLQALNMWQTITVVLVHVCTHACMHAGESAHHGGAQAPWRAAPLHGEGGVRQGDQGDDCQEGDCQPTLE